MSVLCFKTEGKIRNYYTLLYGIFYKQIKFYKIYVYIHSLIINRYDITNCFNQAKQCQSGNDLPNEKEFRYKATHSAYRQRLHMEIVLLPHRGQSSGKPSKLKINHCSYILINILKKYK